MSLMRNTWRSKLAVAVFSVASLVFVTSLLAFSIAISTPTSANSRIKVDLDNGIALRILDKTGTTEISDLAISLEATPTGAFAARNLNVEVSSSNPGGYRLFMSTDYQNGAENTNALVNTEDGSYTVPTLDAEVTKADFSAGNNQYVNHWGYSTDDATYKPLPTYHTNVLVKKTDTEANAEKVPVYFGANADMSIHSGSYRNQVVFSAIANPTPTEYTLYFDAGTSDAVSGLPETMTSSEQSAQHTFTIPSTSPTRDGYAFAGYMDEDTGTLYQPGSTITITGDSSFIGSATLMATWVDSSKGLSSISTMQEMTSGVCANTVIGETATLTDTRDDNTYTVKKLKDGKCWMTQNLRLTGERTLTPSDSNVSSNWPLPAANETFPTSCVDTAYNMKSSTDATTYASYGNYYNWYAATAGTGTCAMTSGNATASICPKGWRLPTGGDNGEFQTLYNNYNSATLMMGDPAFVLSGYRYGSSTDYQGSVGNFWSSTADNSNYAYRLYLNSSYVSPARNDHMYTGLTVRCVVQ